MIFYTLAILAFWLALGWCRWRSGYSLTAGLVGVGLVAVLLVVGIGATLGALAYWIQYALNASPLVAVAAPNPAYIAWGMTGNAVIAIVITVIYLEKN